MHSPFGFVRLTHQNLSAHALFCHNSLPKLNTQLLIYKSLIWNVKTTLLIDLILFLIDLPIKYLNNLIKLKLHFFSLYSDSFCQSLLIINSFISTSSVASPICQEGQSEITFPIFAFSSGFFLFFPNFSPFSRYLASFLLSGGALCPLNSQWLVYSHYTQYIVLRVEMWNSCMFLTLSEAFFLCLWLSTDKKIWKHLRKAEKGLKNTK